MMLTTQDVIQRLKTIAPEITVQIFETSTATSQDAADSIGCEVGQIVKTLLFIVDGEPVVVLASGEQRIDDRKLAAIYDVGRKKVKIATYDQCLEIVGYAPGGVPPVAHRTSNLPIYIDMSLQRYPAVYAAAGSANSIFSIELERLVEITRGQFADVIRD